jgi:Transposase
MPNAQIVADRFHVMAQINKELDGERKKENWTEGLLGLGKWLSKAQKYLSQISNHLIFLTEICFNELIDFSIHHISYSRCFHIRP